MKIVIYNPPPWKIAKHGEPNIYGAEGIPEGFGASRQFLASIGDMDEAALNMASMLSKTRNMTMTMNLFAFAWTDIEQIVTDFNGDLYFLECNSANRRGFQYLAALVRRHRPMANIVAFGEVASAMPELLLKQCPGLDTVFVGECEDTAKEYVDRVAEWISTFGLPGTVYRALGAIVRGPSRSSVGELAQITNLGSDNVGQILNTTRGCAEKCTFCNVAISQGRTVRRRSANSLLDMAEFQSQKKNRFAIDLRGREFTCHRETVMDFCAGIKSRNLKLGWSCEVVPEAVDEEMLLAMRNAGCMRVSLGIESFSEKILSRISRKLDEGAVLRFTELARKYGLEIFCHILVGIRGDSVETLTETLDKVKKARPNKVFCHPFMLLPGSEDFELAEKADGFTDESYLSDPRLYIGWAGMIKSKEYMALANQLVRQYVHDCWRYTLADRQRVAQFLPELGSAQMELAAALYDAGNVAEAEALVEKAAELGYPIEPVLYNYRACLAAAKGDLKGTADMLAKGKEVGGNTMVAENLLALKHWIDTGGAGRGEPVNLVANCEIDSSIIKEQPGQCGILWAMKVDKETGERPMHTYNPQF